MNFQNVGSLSGAFRPWCGLEGCLLSFVHGVKVDCSLALGNLSVIDLFNGAKDLWGSNLFECGLD